MKILNEKNKKVFMFILLSIVIIIGYNLLKKHKEILKARRENVKKNVLLLFSVQPEPCRMPRGDEINEQSYQNKRQYAHLMNYDLIYNRRYQNTHLNITGTYTKLSLLRELLLNESTLASDSRNRHEWFLWIDSDALISDMSFELPFEKYTNYDLVIWGDDKEIKNRNGNDGLNTGVFLLRNSKWSLEFVDLVLTFAVNHGKAREEELKSFINDYKLGLYEQNAIVYILNHEPKYRVRMYFERSFFLNGYWKMKMQYPIPFGMYWNPFTVHFAGCQFCKHHPLFRKQCLLQWDLNYKLANESYQFELRKSKKRDIKYT